MEYPGIDEFIFKVLQEDIGHMDITTDNLVTRYQVAKGVIISKDQGVLAGVELCRRVFACLDPDAIFRTIKHDGDTVEYGDILAEVEGCARSLLTGERVALNFLQHLSGIATKTHKMAAMIKDYKAELVDTRKTAPGLRVLEKYAVKIGGGRNHRFGLYDGVMIKDNHIQIAGGIRKSLEEIKKRIPHTIKIEIEVDTLEQLQEALDSGADIILLDNMTIPMLQEAVLMSQGKVLLEASGGINEHNIVEVAKTGVDFISCGALTHSADSLDISLDITPLFIY